MLEFFFKEMCTLHAVHILSANGTSRFFSVLYSMLIDVCVPTEW